MKTTSDPVKTETPDQIRARYVCAEISKASKAIRDTLDEIRTRIGERGKFTAAEHLLHQAWSLLGAARDLIVDAPDIATKAVKQVQANLTDATLNAFGVTL